MIQFCIYNCLVIYLFIYIQNICMFGKQSTFYLSTDMKLHFFFIDTTECMDIVHIMFYIYECINKKFIYDI